MNLQSYFPRADIGSLSPAEVAGLVPYLIGRPIADEVVAIALCAGQPYMVRTVPLASLGDEVACGIAAAFWTRTAVDQVWLFGHSTRIDDIKVAIARFAAALREDLRDRGPRICLDPGSGRWRFAQDDDERAWNPIGRPDPLVGRMAALVFHSACVATSESEAFAPRHSRYFNGEISAYQDGIALLHSHLADTPERDAADRQTLQEALDADGQVSPRDLLFLGLALESSPRLTQVALAHIWESDDELRSGFVVWTEIARLSRDSVRATACALAALAAWRHADPLAPMAARKALAADPNCLLAQAVSAIIASGALATNFAGDDGFAFLGDPDRDLHGAEGVA